MNGCEEKRGEEKSREERGEGKRREEKKRDEKRRKERKDTGEESIKVECRRKVHEKKKVLRREVEWKKITKEKNVSNRNQSFI